MKEIIFYHRSTVYQLQPPSTIMGDRGYMVYLVFLMVAFQCLQISNANACMEAERDALLQFRDSLLDPSNKLSSWVGSDCCAWLGVGCQNLSVRSYVTKLDLRNVNFHVSYGWPLYNTGLGGKITPSLLRLKQLMYLDLSGNNFSEIQIPEFLGSFRYLNYLNLSSCEFTGRFPYQLGNLSNLEYLDLSNGRGLDVNNLHWLDRLSSLKLLDLSDLNLSRVVDWQEKINMVSSLSELRLRHSSLQNIHMSFPFSNLSSLHVLDLSFNYFTTLLPPWFSNLSGLTHLYLAYNHFEGPLPTTPRRNLRFLQVLDLSSNSLTGGLPKWFGQLRNLERVDLSGNQLNGTLPTWLGHLKSLKSLRLSGNSFSGPIPPSFQALSYLEEMYLSGNELNGSLPYCLGNLSHLVTLDLSHNSFSGIINEHHFASLERLETLDLSDSHVIWNVSSYWIPPFNLKELYLANSFLGPKFPSWLQYQNKVQILWMPNASISDITPKWFWGVAENIYELDLSNNQLQGNLPKSLKFEGANEWGSAHIDLSNNAFQGALPASLIGDIDLLLLSNNSFSGPIPTNLGDTPHLTTLHISLNRLNGSIPFSLCQLLSLGELDLSNNQLSGRIPNCWRGLDSMLWKIDLSNNMLTGDIPQSLGTLSSLASLHLRNNSLSGGLPSTMKNLKSLVTLDLGRNKLSGSIPSWVGTNFLNLRVFSLPENAFQGFLPPELSYLTSLQILDLAHNNLSGPIPKSFGKFHAMRVVHDGSPEWEVTINTYRARMRGPYDEYLQLVQKGQVLEYSKILGLVKLIDLSSNTLYGQIPDNLSNLIGLQGLNLSNNLLTGKIPSEIGALKQLESLDLSQNKLSGAIPSSLSTMTSLVKLNLSYNNLSGKIPSGPQLQTFDNSSYMGNENLCGKPLQKVCPGDHEVPQVVKPTMKGVGESKSVDVEMKWFYITMAYGFGVGFWGFCSVLILKKPWRSAYYNFMDHMADMTATKITVWYIRIKRKLQRGNQQL